MESQLEWYICRRCGKRYTWFRIEVVEGVDIWGWVHEIDRGCESDIGMSLTDKRPGVPDYTA